MDVDRLIRKLGLGFLLGLVVWIGFGIWADLPALKKAWVNIPWQALALIFLFPLIGYIFRFLRWELYLRELDIRISPLQSAIVFFSGFSMSITPGKAGEVLKSFLLERVTRVEVVRSAPIVLAERATDLMAMLLLAAWGIGLFPHGEWLLLATLLFIVVLIILLQLRGTMGSLFQWMKKRESLQRLAEKAEIFYHSSFSLFRWRTLTLALGLSGLSWFLECVALYWIFKGLGVHLGLVEAVFSFAFSSIAGAVSMLPGGLGAAETSLTALLMALGTAQTEAVASTILIRFATLWFGVILGMIVFLGWGQRYLKREIEKQ